jgi:hypothetical protein
MFANPRGIQTRQIVTHPPEWGIAIMQGVPCFRHMVLPVGAFKNVVYVGAGRAF